MCYQRFPSGLVMTMEWAVMGAQWLWGRDEMDDRDATTGRRFPVSFAHLTTSTSRGVTTQKMPSSLMPGRRSGALATAPNEGRFFLFSIFAYQNRAGRVAGGGCSV